MSYDPETREIGPEFGICFVVIFGLIFGGLTFMIGGPFTNIAYVICVLCGVISLVLYAKGKDAGKAHKITSKLVLPSRVSLHDIGPINRNE